MIFFNEKINKFIQDLTGYTDSQMSSIANMYTETIIKMIINECLLYAEKNSIKEFDNIKEAMNKNELPMNKQLNILNIVYSLPAKYPELDKIIREEQGKITTETFRIFVNMMNEEDAIEFLKLVNDDLDYIDRYSKKYLNKKPQET